MRKLSLLSVILGVFFFTSMAFAPEKSVEVKTKVLPKMMDLGATKCKACKEMAPILEELRKTYAGKVDVEFIDLWTHQDMGYKYDIRVMPTQIFFDTYGKEISRHEGPLNRDEILKIWKKLDFKF